MKEFNKDRELNKLKLKNNKNKYIKYGSIILSVLILVIGIIYFTFAKFESRESYTLIEGKVNYSPSDVDLVAYYYDGSKHDEPPTKDNGYIIKNVNCENADGIWSNKSWSLNISNIIGKVKCTLEFEQGEDTSVTPITYGTIIDLGEGTSFDIKTLAPDVDYTSLTNDNFYIIPSSSGSISVTNGVASSCSANAARGSASYTINKSYASSTGILTSNMYLYINADLQDNARCTYNKTNSSTNKIHAYLIL